MRYFIDVSTTPYPRIIESEEEIKGKYIKEITKKEVEKIRKNIEEELVNV